MDNTDPKEIKPSRARPVAQKRPPTMEEMLTAPSAGIFEVRVGQAAYIRQAANELYDNNRIEEAIQLYERALVHLNFDNAKMKFDMTNEHTNAIRDASDPVHLNLARCNLKLKKYREAIKHAKNAVHSKTTEMTLAKAKYLEGKALLCMEEYEAAHTCLAEASQALPVDRGIQTLLKEAKDGINRNRQKDKEVWRGRLKSEESTSTPNRVTSSLSRNQIVGIVSFLVCIVAVVCAYYVMVYRK